MSPKDKTSLWIEFFCGQTDAIYGKTAEQLLEIGFARILKSSVFLAALTVRVAYNIQRR